MVEKVKRLPKHCPSCQGELHVASLRCPECDTRIEGDYPLPALMRLSADDQEFVLGFVCASGSLKQMAQQLGLSYPTVRNRLDDIIALLKQVSDR